MTFICKLAHAYNFIVCAREDDHGIYVRVLVLRVVGITVFYGGNVFWLLEVQVLCVPVFNSFH